MKQTRDKECGYNELKACDGLICERTRVRQGQGPRQSHGAPVAEASGSRHVSRSGGARWPWGWVLTGAQVSVTEVLGSLRGTTVENHTGMCSSLYSSWPSSSKFGSASSESSCRRSRGHGRQGSTHTRALQLLPWTAALTAPRPFQASLSGETTTPDGSGSLRPKPSGHLPQ